MSNMNSNKKLLIYSILLFLIILFFILFFVNLLFTDKLLKFRIYNKELSNKDFNKLMNNKMECTKMCTKNICNEYKNQVIKYNLCKKCNKKGLCYDIGSGDCSTCKNNYTCEQLYGCNNNKPIEPINNYCTRCWIKT
jgi:hypothetical protein